jgi:AAA domain
MGNAVIIVRPLLSVILTAMNIGLCGSHRTGKTTLAEAISRRTGMPFLKTVTSEVFQQCGLDPSGPMDFQKRLWIQHKILDAAEKIWQAEKAQFITDRTPVDMMAYTLADIQGTTEVNFDELEGYLARCIDVTNAFFTLLVLVQPGIPLMHEEGKAALNEGYLEHLNYMILGLCNDARVRGTFVYLHRAMTSLDDRVNTVLNELKMIRDTLVDR